MKMNLIAALTALTVVVTMAGCSGIPDDTAETKVETEATEEVTEEETPEQSGADQLRNSSRLSMSLSGSRSPMQISRPEKKSAPMGDEDTWTIFIYLCGTDLETRMGAAVLDLIQLVEAEPTENVRFVIQTGGTAEWSNDMFSSEQGERWVIENGDIQLIETVPLKSMGDPSYLSDFLKWGVENYPAAKMGVDIWDHGGGCITGACFDEVYGYDSLSLRELDDAFAEVYKNMTDQFEFIGFDCCLMVTAEIANIMASYARYFYGSQESEPGSGWDYTAISNAIAEDPSIDGGDLGKVVADSFYQECASVDQEDGCTFTIVDCSKVDDFVIAFNDYARELFNSASDSLSDIVRGINNAENFGGNNKAEGYTNMVDLGDIVNQCSAYVDGSSLLSAMNDAICYNINGSQHRNASGLSVYYPLLIGGSEELKIYSGVTLSPYYLSLVDMVAKGYTEGGYDNAIFFSEDGGWDSDVEEDDSYFDYADEDDDGESQLITFAQEPSIDEDGIYGFTLDEDGLEYAVGVEAYIYMDIDGDHMVELGETYDLYADWDTGEFSDNFDGYWFSLPDGQLLPTYIAGYDENAGAIYTSPILLNGERTNLRMTWDGESINIEGAWAGIDENGIAARDIQTITAGDKITPVYSLFSLDDDDVEFEGDAYEWQDGDGIVYSYLEAADYFYGFGIEDVYGDYYFTDFVVFSIDEDGNILFNEE